MGESIDSEHSAAHTCNLEWDLTDVCIRSCHVWALDVHRKDPVPVKHAAWQKPWRKQSKGCLDLPASDRQRHDKGFVLTAVQAAKCHCLSIVNLQLWIHSRSLRTGQGTCSKPCFRKQGCATASIVSDFPVEAVTKFTELKPRERVGFEHAVAARTFAITACT